VTMLRGNSVWIYGSHARGDMDASSDIDILIAGDLAVPVKELMSKTPYSTTAASISRYSWDEIAKMANYGSLFLQHIRCEGKKIVEARSCEGYFAELLAGMGEYQNAENDIKSFEIVVNDIQEAIQYSPRIFELSVLAMVIRHMCILGCWLLEKPTFTRVGPILTLTTHFALNPTISAEFSDLYQFRLYSEGRVLFKDLPDKFAAEVWIDHAREILSVLKEQKYGNR